MKREIAVCDRCGKEAETPDEMKELDLHSVILGTERRFNSYNSTKIPTYAAHALWDKDWCLECRKITGLVVVQNQKYDTPAASVPSLEDMIREIVRSEIG